VHKIRIDGSGPSVHSYKIFIDNIDISGVVQEITINMAIDAANMITLICRGCVELPPELEAIVQATRLEQIEVTTMSDDEQVYINE